VPPQNRFELVTSPVRQGQYAARVEVNEGGKWRNTSGERAEMANMSREDGTLIPENETSGTQFYAFSVRLEPNWQTPQGAAEAGEFASCPPPRPDRPNYAWGTILQLHGPDDLDPDPQRVLSTSPSLSFDVNNKWVPDAFSISTNAGELDPNDSFRNQTAFALSEGELNRGHWVDFILEVRWAGDNTGVVNVWRRDEGEPDFAQVLAKQGITMLQYLAGSNILDHYRKHGFYRPDCKMTNVLWLDGMTRGTTFNAVRSTAFGS
jgi:hypothetical protein